MNKTVESTIDLLGRSVKDKISGFRGIVTSVGFDLFGCVQAVVTPELKDGKKEEGQWFDTKRLDVLPGSRVMELPTFESVPGGISKPAFRFDDAD